MQHFLARGVATKDGKILLAYFPKKEYYFLPGGHIELGESGKTALTREIMEELGCEAEVQNHLTTFEHAYQGDTEMENELTLVYGFSISGNVQSKVEHLIFDWVSLSDFENIKFLPKALKEIVLTYAKGVPMPAFVSTL